MPYRRTDRVLERLAARRGDIVSAARALAATRGLAAVQIVPVAERAGIAAGTVYRYFPAKSDLVAALLAQVTHEEVASIDRVTRAAPGPLSALAAAVTAFAVRAVRERRLVSAMLGEPGDVGHDESAAGASFRRAILTAFEARIRAAVAAGGLPDQDAAVGARAVLGALVETTIGPLALEVSDAGKQREAVQAVVLHALRGLGVADARARGLVVQAPWPADGT